jgi:hypothetical protein
MSQAGLSPDVLDLIARHLDSMEQVQALLVLRREPDRVWRVEEIAEEVRASAEKTATALTTLSTHNLATVAAGEPKAYRYSPATAALRTAVDNLEIAYNTRPVTLVRALYDRPTRSIQSFADAFRLRKPDSREE